MATQYVTYETRQHGETKWQLMPHAVPVQTTGDESTTDAFDRVFRQCFGNTLAYQIIAIANRRPAEPIKPIRIFYRYTVKWDCMPKRGSYTMEHVFESDDLWMGDELRSEAEGRVCWANKLVHGVASVYVFEVEVETLTVTTKSTTTFTAAGQKATV